MPKDEPDALIPTDPNDPDRPIPIPVPPRPSPQPPRPTPSPPRPRPTPTPTPIPIPSDPLPNDPGDGPTDPYSIRLFADYFPDGLLSKIPQMIAKLEEIIVPRFNPEAVVSGDGIAVNNARKALVALLKSEHFTTVRQALFGAKDIRVGVRDSLMRRDFTRARSELDAIKRAVHSSALGQATIQSALKRTATEYTVDLPVGPPFRQFMKAYEGPAITTTQLFRLTAYASLVGAGKERNYLVALLSGDIHMGQRANGSADGEYVQALAVSGLNTAQKRLAAIKAAQARVEMGDREHRSTSRVTSTVRDKAKKHYDAALAILTTHGVPSTNLDRKMITARVDRAKAMTNSRLNVFGLRDSFMPVQRYTHLRDLARQQMTLCAENLETYENDLRHAEEELNAVFEVAAERAAEATTAKIMDIQTDNATLSERSTNEKVAMLEAQQDFLIAGTLIAGAGQIVQSAATFGVGVPGGGGTGAEKAGGVLGIASTGLNFFAQRNELGHQLAMARIEQQIAGNQIAIAELQEQLTRDRIAYLDRKAALLSSKKMNAEFLFERAAFRETLLIQRLQACIFLAYLAERAVAFFFGNPNRAQGIQFNYLDTKLGVGAALDTLRRDFENMVVAEEASLDDEHEPGSGFVERVSLRENYPLQFQRFLESDDGRMDFVYSLYQLSKVRPATHQCRLYQVGVEVKGLVPEGKLRGTLAQSGRFLVRDRLATLDPADPPTRLVPTQAELEAALAEQAATGSAVAAVGGVLFYTLPDDEVLDLSQASEVVPPPPPDVSLSTFEGYGPTGLWSLLVEDHRRLDITDIVLHFGILNRESDPGQLRDTVRRLVREYEDELRAGDDFDRVDLFMLRQAFPDAYFALESGAGTFELEAESFDPEFTDLQLKAVIVQAVDPDNDGLPGVGVVVRRDDVGFALERVTGPGGFSENLDEPLEELPPAERFPLLGTWQVALADPAQFSQLGDLRLLFLYSYVET